MNERLYRSRHDRVIAGVAAGLAERLGADPSLIRILWVLLVPVTGFLALLVYVVMAVVVPEESSWATWPATTAPYAPAPPEAAVGRGEPEPGTSAGPSWDPAGPSPEPSTPLGPPPAPAAPPAYMPIPPVGTQFPSIAAGAPVAWVPPRRRERSGVGGLIVGAFLVLIGAWLLIEQFYPSVNFDLVWPLFIVGAGVLLLVAAFRRGSPGSPGIHQ